MDVFATGLRMGEVTRWHLGGAGGAHWVAGEVLSFAPPARPRLSVDRAAVSVDWLPDGPTGCPARPGGRRHRSDGRHPHRRTARSARRSATAAPRPRRRASAYDRRTALELASRLDHASVEVLEAPRTSFSSASRSSSASSSASSLRSCSAGGRTPVICSRSMQLLDPPVPVVRGPQVAQRLAGCRGGCRTRRAPSPAGSAGRPSGAWWRVRRRRSRLHRCGRPAHARADCGRGPPRARRDRRGLGGLGGHGCSPRAPSEDSSTRRTSSGPGHHQPWRRAHRSSRKLIAAMISSTTTSSRTFCADRRR